MARFINRKAAPQPVVDMGLKPPDELAIDTRTKAIWQHVWQNHLSGGRLAQR